MEEEYSEILIEKQSQYLECHLKQMIIQSLIVDLLGPKKKTKF